MVNVRDEAPPEVRSRVVATKQAEGGAAQNRVWQVGRQQKRAPRCSNCRTRRKKPSAGRVGMWIHFVVMRDMVVSVPALSVER